LKYLLVSALIALLFWLAYRWLRPYIRTLRKMLGILRGTLGKPPASQSEFGRSARTENKLVRCAACKTWIPQGRVLHSNAASYCSKACLQKAPAVKRRKEAS
jgi:hypothetical protein